MLAIALTLSVMKRLTVEFIESMLVKPDSVLVNPLHILLEKMRSTCNEPKLFTMTSLESLSELKRLL